MTQRLDMDVIIIGGGMVGLSTAMACAQAGLSVAVIDRRDLSAASADGRASALAASSLRMMKRLGVDLSHHLQPIRDMLVVEGDADSPWRLHFEGDGDGADLGALIENRHIEAGLLATVHGDNRIRVLDGTSVLSAEHDATGVRVETDGAVLTGRLMVAADGRHSWLRRQAGISRRVCGRASGVNCLRKINLETRVISDMNCDHPYYGIVTANTNGYVYVSTNGPNLWRFTRPYDGLEKVAKCPTFLSDSVLLHFFFDNQITSFDLLKGNAIEIFVSRLQSGTLYMMRSRIFMDLNHLSANITI